VQQTPHFAFYSDFATNLNDALIASGLARRRHEAEMFKTGPEADCFAKRPAPERAGWEAAVSYYAQAVSGASWNDREQFLIRMQLAGFDAEIRTDDDRQLVTIARGLRDAAAPAYGACRWPAQGAANRAWIEALLPRLTADEEEVATRLERLYGKKWDRLPIPVDIVQVVNWAGANSTIDPPHLLVAVENEGLSGLEVVFHEASHVLMARNDPVQKALDDAAAAGGKRVPPDLWHLVLFFTTGEVVREVLAKEKIDYTPMLEGLFAKGSWTDDRQALVDAWRPYVEGKRPLRDAAAALVAALPDPLQKPVPTP
jgi:hypothetical protein